MSTTEEPMWQGDRDYRQAQWDHSRTPERYGGGLGLAGQAALIVVCVVLILIASIAAVVFAVID